MNDFYEVPIFNGENGEHFFETLSKEIGRPKDMLEVAVLSTVRLLVYLPEPICTSIISPMVALPLLMNHSDSIVKRIVRTRLKTAV